MESKSQDRLVRNVDGYIKAITALTQYTDEGTVVVYRGENKYYETHCQPNLFRNDYFKNNKYFEKNLLDELKSNRLTKGETYLEIAVDAQHGGFPSRLLDVTYNSLVALYFAVTPSIKDAEDAYDDCDGYVHIFYIKDIFCPSADNINLIFDTLVDRKKEWVYRNTIFQRNHKLIDHIRINNRIIAQQGAFILFQGDEAYPIQKSDYLSITIDKDSKKEIRKYLKLLFGIHTGSIYPEVENLVKDIGVRSNRINNSIFSLKNELELAISNLSRELNHQLKEIVKIVNKQNEDIDELENEIIKVIIYVEKTVYNYKKDIIDLIDMEDIEPNYKKEIVIGYNKIINKFITKVSYCIGDYEIEINSKNLTIKENGNIHGER